MPDHRALAKGLALAHQSLYRAYRPQGFDDVVGQQHITRTLRNAVAEGMVAHAYLFCGPRGTGKTTTARILAKALECEKGPTPDPDLTCQECVDIAEGRHPDVFELDAASRTGVENVREEIIGRLMYAPTRGRWKVYIIDEVHMLSTGAFNALLKSVEEPPPRTVFILCTTHPHKVPETIHSRCQRFDFHRIGVEDMVGRLAHICEREDITVAEGVLSLVAKHAAGGMRDAISTLEQLATFTGKNVSLADVEGLLGEVDSALLHEMADIIARRDIGGAFGFVSRLASAGTDLSEFVRGMTAHMRDLYVIAAVGDATGIVDTTGEELGRLTSQAAQYGSDRLARILDLLGELGSEMRWSSDQRLSLEVALVRMARPQGDLTMDALAERLDALERGMPATPVRPPAPSARTAGKPAAAPAADTAAAQAGERATRANEPSVPASQTHTAPTPHPPTGEPVVIESRGGALDRAQIKRAWPAVLAEMKKLKASRAAFFSATEADLDSDGSAVVVEFPADQQFTMEQAGEPDTRDLLARALTTVLGQRPLVRYQLGRGAVRPEGAPATDGSQHAPVSSAGEAPRDAHPAPDETDNAPAASSAEGGGASVASATRSVAGGYENDEDIERLLVDDLGAQVLVEHHETDDGG